MNYYLGIDPGLSKKHAYAIISEEEKLQTFGLFGLDEPVSFFEILDNFFVEKAFIESQYIGKNKRQNIALSQKAGEIKGYLSTKGIESEFIDARLWTSAYMRQRRGWPKRKVYLHAVHWGTISQFELDLDGYKIDPQRDICCAIQIGLYGLRQLKTEQLIIMTRGKQHDRT